MIVIPYYDGYVLDVPVQANDVLVLLIQQMLLMFHSREEIEALQGPGCIPWWISCNDSCSLVCAPTLQINFRPPTLKPLFYAVHYSYSQNNEKSIAYSAMRKIQYNIMRFRDSIFRRSRSFRWSFKSNSATYHVLHDPEKLPHKYVTAWMN
jgi:hypothetical protein